MSSSSTLLFGGLGGDGGATPCTCFGRKGYFVGTYWGTFSECVKVSREIRVRDIGYEKRIYNRIQAWGKRASLLELSGRPTRLDCQSSFSIALLKSLFKDAVISQASSRRVAKSCKFSASAFSDHSR
jgi:hypothetical protein